MPDRHCRAWVRPGARLAFPRGEPGDAEALTAWFDAGLPAVVCRSDGRAPPGELALGVLLPSGESGRGRPVACRVAVRDVRRIEPPPGLAEVASRASGIWRRGLGDLIRMVEGSEDFGVYGSHMWQTVTRRRYVRDDSDIDLCIPARGRCATGAIGKALLAWERRTGLRADGEFIFSGGAAVSWREYHAGSGREVLVKGIRSVGMASREELTDAVPR
ncbi:MAG: malonate decarboxylase holo-[acyl-carrier-protein] synthase [Chlamydiota bacterium]